MTRVAFPCPGCRAPLERVISGDPAAPCERCGRPIELRPDALQTIDASPAPVVVACPACGGTMLYKQKDFRQAIGCLVVLVAAVLAPFTYYVSLGVAALIDLVLYWLAGDVIICYRIACHAHVRGAPAGSKACAFDLSIHDYHRMLARREEQGLSGPDEKTGPPLDAGNVTN